MTILDEVIVERQRIQDVKLSGRPIVGWLSSAYGNRIDPITGQPAWHAGIDFAGSHGRTIAVASGVVVFADRRDGYGNMVEIHHGNGITSRYGHHDKLLVKRRPNREKGDVIGLMGNSGRSTAHMFTLRCSVTVETLILAVLSAMLLAVANPKAPTRVNL